MVDFLDDFSPYSQHHLTRASPGMDRRHSLSIVSRPSQFEEPKNQVYIPYALTVSIRSSRDDRFVGVLATWQIPTTFGHGQTTWSGVSVYCRGGR